MKRLSFIAALIVMAIFNSSCNDKKIEGPVSPDETVSQEDDTPSLPLACIQWGIPLNEVKTKMEDYTLAEEQTSLLVYENPYNNSLVSYQFQEGCLMATSVIFCLNIHLITKLL